MFLGFNRRKFQDIEAAVLGPFIRLMPITLLCVKPKGRRMNTTKVFMTISPGILLDQEMILKGTVSNAAATSAAFPGIAQNSLLGLSNTFY